MALNASSVSPIDTKRMDDTTISTAEAITFRGFKGETSRPILSHHDPDASSKIPVIDCERIFSHNSEDRLEVARLLSEALRKTGIIYAVNHGISEDVIDQVRRLTSQFFKLPVDRKLELHESKSKAKRGYQYVLEGRDDEPGRNDCREAFKMTMDNVPATAGDTQSASTLNVWPTELPEFRSCMELYSDAVLRFAQHFRQMIALSIGAPQDFFDKLSSGASGLSVLYYPSRKEQIGEGRRVHTDYSLFTVINQLSNVPGLEYLDETGHFVLVPPLPGSIVVNIGDVVERSSNYLYKSTIHRVLNDAERERYSIVYFFDPNPEQIVRVAQTCICETRPRLHDDIKAGIWNPGLYSI